MFSPISDTLRRALLATLTVATVMVGAWVAQAADTKPDAPLSRAFTAQDAKDWTGARTIVEKEQTVVRDLVQWRYVSSSSSGATFDEISQFLASHATWPGRSTIAQRGEETLQSENLVATRGAEWFKARTPRTSAGCLAWGRHQFTLGQKAEALATIKRCWLALTLTYTDYQDWATFSSMPLPEADHLLRTDALLWGRNVTGAREMLALLTGDARTMAAARVDIQSGKPVDIEDAMDNATTPAWAASLGFDQAVQLRKGGRTKEAWDLLMKVDASGALPAANAQAWWPEHNLSARNALEAKEYEIAYRLAARTRVTPEANLAAYLDAEFLAGWIALRFLDEEKQALRHFTSLEAAARSPISRARAAYWKAQAFRALDEAGKAQQALAIAAAEPGTFYGRLALEMLKDPRQASPASPKPSAAPSTENTTELALAAEVLMGIGDTRRANAFANAAIEVCQTTGCATALSARLATIGNTYGALRSAKKAQTLGMIRTDQLYPLIDLPPACMSAGVPRALVLALTRQESEFDPTATSSANARGLMQLLPATAQDAAKRYGLPYAGANDLYQPQANLALGCYHLKDLLDGLNGSYVLSIAGYNAGKARVTSWTTTRGDPRDPKVDVIDWIESIPFDETRNYVMRVLENELAYTTRLGEPLQAKELNLTLRRQSP
jgi:soluble lytic murein transglycosylase